MTIHIPYSYGDSAGITPASLLIPPGKNPEYVGTKSGCKCIGFDFRLKKRFFVSQHLFDDEASLATLRSGLAIMGVSVMRSLSH